MAGDHKKRGLGRGLSALFGEAEAIYGDNNGASIDTAGRTTRIPVEHLSPGRFQPRRSFDEDGLNQLAESIRQHGLLTPLLVRRIDSNHYEIVAGERRWRAAQRAQLHEIPAVVRELDDSETLEVALVENLQRQDLSPIEEAEGYRRLIDEFAHTQDVLARLLGKSRSHVANMLRLLNLSPEIRAMVEDGRLSAGHARALLNARDPDTLARDVVQQGLTVRQTEDRVAAEAEADHNRQRTKRPRKAKDPDILALERDISESLGLRVTLDARDAKRGRVVVEYGDLDQLDAVIRRLRAEG